MQITHHNHFVPQSYLRRWSDDGHHVWCYRILVPNKKAPEWVLKPVHGVAYHRDLYTASMGGKDIDEFERWLETEFETPAQIAIDRAIHGDILSSSDWERLIRYMAAQQVRTPQNYNESIKRWNDQIPELIQKTLDNAMREYAEAKRAGKKLIAEDTPIKNPYEDVIKVKIDPYARPATNEAEVSITVLAGRRLWLDGQRHILTGVVKVLASHNWSVVEAANKVEWITSDDPVIRLNYYADGSYDFKGGWGRDGTDIFMPLSPKYLLFTEVGKDLPKRFTASDLHTYQIQRSIAKGAHRMIFAHKQIPFINQLCPRIDNREMYREENEAWRKWHSQQSKAEQDLDESN
jgi:hypothetical protein